ncbi:AfsR/SARP family transcriptional regulator [Actinophytocola xanthii]|uniref:AfsR family transcriptional regulator n=1 Tax=Actinophytocola xanthii TaxID=1912961 RepID=A0A1Q8CDU4_9PSEU|nr:tetratricopeptide repeat protein [Actinophytocola xanthii]OLF12526.1 AfsR family transcriptional regulator [Actinophytocola xanthii]
MELRLLGPVEVHAGGRTVAVGPPQCCEVLAALAVDAGRPVPVPVLVDRVWGTAAPQRARRTLHTHLTRIRRLLERTGTSEGEAAPVVRRGGGYALEIDPARVDLHRYRDLVEQARDPACPQRRRLSLLREARGLWRGEPLSGLPGAWAARTRDAWLREHLDTVVAWARAELEIGNAVGVVEPLSRLLAEHPLVESLTATVMRALHAAGRQAEALERYGETRQRLVDELGVEPGDELRRTHLAILRGGLRQAPAPSRPAGPAQLPLDVPGFTGRAGELAQLDGVLSGAEGRAATVVVSAVSGTAGVGKTALAVHWAHRVADRFPDGQLYVNLRGYDPDQPVSAGDALAGLLSALGVPTQDIPLGVEERAVRYRSELAHRRVLVLLDNASTAEQVRPLLPGALSCTALVTSRDSLAGLVALHGARRLDLDLLPHEDAVALLRRLIGKRAEAEPRALADLAERCARLPLALRVAAELAVSRPTSTLADLADDLADQRRRLHLLDAGGDPRAAVTSVFSWSVRHLPPDAARMFPVLGLHPGPDLDAYAAAALVDTSLDLARRALTTLDRAHLVHATDHGRFGMHDLLRAYATSLATGEDAADESRAALDRLFDYYLATAAAAMDVLHPAEEHHRTPSAGRPAPELSDPDRARSWLDAERANLVATAVHAAGHGRPRHAIGLSTVLYRYLDAGHYTDALTLHTHAHQAAAQVGDLGAQAHALLGIGKTYRQLSRHEPALEHLHQALALFRRTGDRTGQAQVLNGLCIVEGMLGRHGPAVEYLHQALELFREAGDEDGQARVLGNLSIIERRLGAYDTATAHCDEALALYRRSGDRDGEARALETLGILEQQRGYHQAALEHLGQSLALYRTLGNHAGEASALDTLGIVHTRLGRPERAVEHLRRSLELRRESRDREGEAWARNGLGAAAHAAGAPAEALAHHTAALDIATEIGARDQQARARAGLGHAHRALDDPDTARSHYREALALYLELGMPEAEEVRADLAALGSPDLDPGCPDPS